MPANRKRRNVPPCIFKRRGVHHGWEEDYCCRRARFYSLTRPGRRQLETEMAHWLKMSAAINRVVELMQRIRANAQAGLAAIG